MNAYLAWSLLFGLIWIALWIHRKDLRYEMLFSSILFTPFGLTDPLFIPEYWNPVVLFKVFGLFDIEALIWSFSTGGVVAVLYEEIFKIRLGTPKFNKQARFHAILIYIFMAFSILALILINHATELSTLRSALFLIFLGIIYLIYSRPDLFKKSLVSGIFFTVLYVISLLLINFIFPEFITKQWTLAGSWGITIFSIVLEEYLYAFLFGIFWSIIYEEMKNVRLRKSRKPF